MNLRAVSAVTLSTLLVLSLFATPGFAAAVVFTEPDPTSLDHLDGAGTTTDPYVITTVAELQAMSEDLTAHYELGADIDASSTATWNGSDGFDPIGDEATPFTGTFDGQQNTISNVVINRSEENYVGLFGVTSEDATITGVHLDTVDITGERYVGGLVGKSNGHVDASTTSGEIHAYGYAGGLVGSSPGTLTNSRSTADVFGGGYGTFGGLAGANSGTVSNTYAMGHVEGEEDLGGLLGQNSESATVTQSYATGSVVDTGSNANLGGLIGANDGTVEDSYWNLETTGLSTGIDQNYGTADIEGLSTPEMTGSSSETYLAAFDFQSTWESVNNSHPNASADGYPILQGLDAESQITTPAIEHLLTGSGFLEDPYLVSNINELQAVREYPHRHYVLTDDIDASANSSWNDGDGFEPIGTENAHFTGTFDGQGHAITNVTISEDSGHTGLFAWTASGAVVERVILENVSVDGGGVTGALIAENHGTVRNTSVSGVVTSEVTSTGGLIGVNVGTVVNSSASATVEGSSNVGGLIGTNEGLGDEIGSVLDSHASGDVSATGRDVGGLIGYSDRAEVRTSYATGDVQAPATAGGLIGQSLYTSVTDSFATGTVAVNGTNAGGLIGRLSGSSTVTATYIRDTFATGTVVGDIRVGGLIGWNEESQATRSYAVGTVVGNDESGGLVGDNDGTIEDSYWDSEATNRTDGAGTNEGEFAAVGLTTLAMIGTAAESNMSHFDFTSTWESVESSDKFAEDRSYPILQAHDPEQQVQSLAGLGPEATFVISPAGQIDTDETVTFDANNSSAVGAIDSYHWDFGDGETVTTSDPVVTHSYDAYDSYHVHLEIETASGETNQTTATVHVAEEGTSIWEYTTDDLIDSSSPTIVDGTAYVGDENGTVYAVDVDTGDTVWTFHHDPYPDDDSPTVVDGVVYITSRESSGVSSDHYLHAIDADTGEELWNITLGRSPVGSTVYGDTVYVTTRGDWDVYNGYVLAYDADDGTQRWAYETTTPPTSAPTVTNGSVYVGDSVGIVYALDADSGDESWTWEGDDEIPHAPTVADGIVYVPVNDLVPNFEVDVNQYRGYVYALDATDGSTIWEDPFVDAELDRGITSAPTVHNGTLYVAGGGDSLYAVDGMTGEEMWTFGTQAPMRAAPTVVEAPGELHRTIDDELVLVGNDDGNLYAVGTDTSVAHWIYDAGGWVRSSPTVADGTVYVGADYFEPGDPDTVGDDGVREGVLHAISTNLTRSSADSRVELATLGHTEEMQSYLDVEITSSNESVLEGDTVVVEATVSNSGQEATGAVELEDFGGTVVDSETVTVGRNGETSVTLALPTSSGDAGIGDLTVTTPDDSDSAEVAIQQEVDFEGCRVIDTPGVYTVTGGQLSSSTCIEITSSYVELDGQGIALTGGGGMDDGAHGIHLNGADDQLTNVVIHDVYLVDWASFAVDNAGIRIDNVENSEFSHVRVENSYYGIWADGLNDSIVNESDFTTVLYAGGGVVLDSSSNNTIANTEVANPFFGIDVDEQSDDNVLTDSTVGRSYYGLRILESDGFEVSNVDARYNGPDFYRDNSVTTENYTLSAPPNITVERTTGEESSNGVVYASNTVEADVSAVPAPDVTVSFEASSVDLEAVRSPAPNPNAHALGQYLSVSGGASDAAYLDLKVHYDEAHLDGVAESNLSLWRYDANDETWSEIADQSVDTEQNVVASNLTTFGTIGVFVTDPGTADPAVPVTAEITDLAVVAEGDFNNVLEEPATNAGGTEWTATIDVTDLPESRDDTYDLRVETENTFGDEWSVPLSKTLEVTEAPTAEFEIADISDKFPDGSLGDDQGDVTIEVIETAGVQSRGLEVTLQIERLSDGVPVYEETIDGRALQDETGAFTFDVGTVGEVDAGEYAAVLEVDADNADAVQEIETFWVGGVPQGTIDINDPVTANQETVEIEYSFENTTNGAVVGIGNTATLPNGMHVETVTENGTIEVTTDELGGIESGDSLIALIWDGREAQPDGGVPTEVSPLGQDLIVTAEPPNVTVVDANLSREEITAGEEALINVTFTNTGDEEESINVSFFEEGSVFLEQQYNVSANSNRTVTLTRDYPNSGTYNITIQSDTTGNTVEVGSVTVNEDTSTDAPGFGIVPAAFALLAVVLVLGRRQS
ncbi:outer membrane protein assembly factor BamB family protein [Halobellus captivus]|uniref:outer membrane protein assembly factor BamB family protein n=1 Tax=Halobellus captivus TaxID=2592614 RepID=UPI0011A01A12|nr:PQQ-binding-like beta-propeller repeat protein [Halobellus captivus]